MKRSVTGSQEFLIRSERAELRKNALVPMSSDSDSELPTMTVINSRSGADFEAGRGQPRGEHIDSVDVVDARLPKGSHAGSSGSGSGKRMMQPRLFGMPEAAPAASLSAASKRARKVGMWNGDIKGVPHQRNGRFAM